MGSEMVLEDFRTRRKKNIIHRKILMLVIEVYSLSKTNSVPHSDFEGRPLGAPGDNSRGRGHSAPFNTLS